ncbi:purine-cytosine permease family protein [Streptomyces sp. NPDC008343]|uniref:purine-cytosine permease family protein n=1 Tax=Streptomyces sp. NPDC008343 TaxID=3364828 RepID=UPI0036E14D95
MFAVEPAGAEPIPATARHGHAMDLMWTWIPPNMEFATVYIGVVSVLTFDLGFWVATAALVLGAAFGSLAHGLLSSHGPRYGVPQMVVGRVAFGRWGNALPAALNTLGAGLGWFTVNSVAGAHALNGLTGMPNLLCLVLVAAVQIAVAYFGHNLVHRFGRYVMPLVTLAFLASSVVVLSKAHLTGGASTTGSFSGFMLAFSAAFGYAAGWNPFAADYTRYLPADTARPKAALCPALGVFASISLLTVVGAASATIATDQTNPTGAFTSHLPGWLSDITLLAIVAGAVAANAMNTYSGAISFVSLWPRRLPRAPVALVIGLIAFLFAWSALDNASRAYQDFLLVIAYWVSSWLAVIFTDEWLRNRNGVSQQEALRRMMDPAYEVWAGPVAMVVGAAIAVLLFSHQKQYTGIVAHAAPSIGDLTCVVAFALTAALYVALRQLPGLGPGSRYWATTSGPS